MPVDVRIEAVDGDSENDKGDVEITTTTRATSKYFPQSASVEPPVAFPHQPEFKATVSHVEDVSTGEADGMVGVVDGPTGLHSGLGKDWQQEAFREPQALPSTPPPENMNPGNIEVLENPNIPPSPVRHGPQLISPDLNPFPEVDDDQEKSSGPEIGPGILGPRIFFSHPAFPLNAEPPQQWVIKIDSIPEKASPKNGPPLSSSASISSYNIGPPSEPSTPSAASSSSKPKFVPPTLDDILDSLPSGPITGSFELETGLKSFPVFVPELGGWIVYQTYLGSYADEKAFPPQARAQIPQQLQTALKQSRKGDSSLCNLFLSNNVASGSEKTCHWFHKVEGAFVDGDEKDDLFACCLCPLSVVVKQKVHPTVVPKNLIDELIREKASNPPLGHNDVESVKLAFDILTTMVTNAVIHGETRAVKPLGNKGFQRKLGWSPLIQEIFERMTFRLAPETPALLPAPPLIPDTDVSTPHLLPAHEPELVLSPPAQVDSLTPEGRQIMLTRLRNWVELKAWFGNFIKVKGAKNLEILLEPASLHDLYSGALPQAVGGDITRITPQSLVSDNFKNSLEVLGVLRDGTLPSMFITRAFLNNMKFDHCNRSVYLGALDTIAKAWVGAGQEELSFTVVIERSKGTKSEQELREAFSAIGITPEYCEEISVDAHDFPDGNLVEMFHKALGEIKEKLGSGTPEFKQAKMKLIEALKVLQEHKISPLLKDVISETEKETMDPKEAYKMFECTEDIDNEMILTLYEIRISDSPFTAPKWKAALSSIADARNSDKLRKFVHTGRREMDVPATAPVSATHPVGLDNIGNTCYLNSLLQYFYTIAELRDCVVNFQRYDGLQLATVQDIRVGGRAVSTKEIERSNIFIKQLGDLFTSLQYSNTAAIAPARDLAYLALVTSQDEEQDNSLVPVVKSPAEPVVSTLPVPVPRNGEETSTAAPQANMTDAAALTTLALSPNDAMASPPSILGKRSSVDREDDAMDVDCVEQVLASTSSQPRTSSVLVPTEEDASVVSSEVSQTDSSGAGSSSPRKTLRTDNYQCLPAVEPTISVPELASINNASVSALAPPLQTPILNDNPADMAFDPSMPPTMLQPTRTTSSTSQPPSLPPPKQALVSANNGDMMFGKQHDVSECMDNCLFQIEAAMDTSSPSAMTDSNIVNIIQRLFYGKSRQVLQFEDEMTPSAAHDKDVIFNHVLLNVGEDGGSSRDIHDGLADYFSPELIDLGGKKGLKAEIPIQLPALFHVQLQRAQFDRETAQPYKSNAFIKFPETLYMDRYSENSDPKKKAVFKQNVQEMKRLRNRIDELRRPRKQGYSDSLLHLSSLFSSKAIKDGSHPFHTTHLDDTLLFELRDHELSIKTEQTAALESVEKLKQQTEEIWKDEQKQEYELSSVFIHRGNVGFGHYYLYQRNLPHNPDEWFKYNDSYVTKVPKEEVLGDTTGSNANPYLLVYAKKGSNIIDTVCRTIV